MPTLGLHLCCFALDHLSYQHQLYLWPLLQLLTVDLWVESFSGRLTVVVGVFSVLQYCMRHLSAILVVCRLWTHDLRPFAISNIGWYTIIYVSKQAIERLAWVSEAGESDLILLDSMYRLLLP